MGSTKSVTAGKTDGAEKPERVSASSKSTVSYQPAPTRIVQNVLLIWLDNNIDENNLDYRNTIIQLRRIVNSIHMFTDTDRCVEFINTVTDNKACMIISGLLGQHIIPGVHNMSQIDSIFILCENKKLHEQWSKKWSKIKGVFTEISLILEALRQAAQQCEQNAIPISFVATDNDTFSKNLNQLDPSFMYTQILKEIVLSIEFEQQHINEFIKHCRVVFNDNVGELENVDKLKQNYRNETPIWWYKCECFLYPMLNRALRLMNLDIIIKIGFFISDLHRHIEHLHHEQFNKHYTDAAFTVYRGQGLSKTNFNQLMNTKNGVMSFNNFLSTSKNRDVSLDFSRNALTNPDSVGILFVMTIDPSKSSTSFASITTASCFKAEDEVLFSMHTIFRIHDIKLMTENERLFQVDLTLISDNDKDIRLLTDCIREEIQPNTTGWEQLGSLLFNIGKPGKAQQVYEVLLDQTINESQKAVIYDQLGRAKFEQREFQEAVILCEKAVEIVRKTLHPTHINLADSFSNIGLIYENMGEHSQALSYYKKALKIKQQSLPPNHASLAMYYSNIGGVYYKMDKYPEAHSSCQKALKIRQHSLPSNHPDLASSYNNIGSLYGQIGEYAKALPYFEKAYKIYQKSLLPNDPDLAMACYNIGHVYTNIEEYSKALSFYELAVDIGQHSLPSNHPELQRWKNNLDRVKDKL